jgi:uncharacterized protein YcbK (DUF882 family)
MKLSPNFGSHEFACRCCGKVPTISRELLTVLETLRTDLGAVDEPVAVVITSGYRCPKHNKNVGGAPNSQHVQGIAADIRVVKKSGRPVPPALVADYLEKKYPTAYGVGRYKGWTHIDVRRQRARWGSN